MRSIIIGVLIGFALRFIITAVLLRVNEHRLLALPLKEDSSFYCDARLQPYLNEFVTWSRYYKYDCEKLWKLDSISLCKTTNCHGVTRFFPQDNHLHGTIEISQELVDVKDTAGLRLVIFHELSHWLRLEHDESLIMMKRYDTIFSPLIRDNWEDIVEEHFEVLNSKKKQ